MNTGKKRIIGITGGIGAGKSVVSRILRHQGFPVYDCDLEAIRLMEEDVSLIRGMKFIFGREVYDQDGRLCRGYVSQKLFSDRSIRESVNKLVHAAVRDDFREWSKNQHGTHFIESAILSTGGLEPMCDEIWIVDAPEDVRIERVRRRNGFQYEEIKRRIRSQRNEIEKLPVSKIIRVNNGENCSLLTDVLKLLENYKD